jgi:sensor histidine kinase YesM
MERAEKGHFDHEISIQGSGEIRTLGESFNKMIYEINNLIIERDLKEKERSKEEMKALHAQINPHFIYNTLNSIRLMAMMTKAQGIKNMTDAFMKLLSATFKEDGTLIPVRKEIEYLENYVYIMKVRYGDHFDMELMIDEEIKDLLIIKLILQPIVENAILHGLSKLTEGGKICVKGFMDHADAVFEITDNGVGMTEEEIKKLLTEGTIHRRSFNHIGVMNVDRRIKLNYGEGYGMSIQSEYGKYTTVRLVLPKIINDMGGEMHA